MDIGTSRNLHDDMADHLPKDTARHLHKKGHIKYGVTGLVRVRYRVRG